MSPNNCDHVSRPSRLYGLPKIHKDGVPLKPIVSTIGSPTYGLAKHLAGLLGSHLGLTSHHVKNSEDFAQTLDTLHVGSKDILVNFDVISLFTRVPLNDALDLLTRHFDANIFGTFPPCPDILFLFQRAVPQTD
jgi:hypothetical protein